MKSKSLILITLLAGSLAFLVGCGNGETESEQAYTDDGRRIIEIQGNDQMRFNLAEIRAQAGEELRLVFTNVGRMPKESMGHNWVLFAQMNDSELNEIAMAAARRSPEYLPEDRSAVLAHTDILGPGESETLDFTAPTDPGTYTFACTFPGHFAVMKGDFIVE